MGLRPPLAKWVPKPIQRQRAPKLRRKMKGGAKLGLTAPFRKCRGGFSRSYSSASQCPCRHQRWTPLAPPEGRSSLDDHAGPSILFLTYWPQRPGLPLRLSETAKRRISTQGRSRLVAAVAGGSANWAKSTSWALHYHRQIRRPCLFVNSSSSLKPPVASQSGLTYSSARGSSPIEFHVLP